MTTPQYASVSPVQFPLGLTCQGPVWAGGSGTVTVVNQDNQFTAYVGYTNSITPGGANTAPLGPGASMTFPGGRALYAVGQKVGMMPLLLMPGAIQYSPGAIPATELFSLTTQSIAANSSFTTPIIAANPFTAYDMQVNAQTVTQGTAGASFTCQIEINWFADAAGNFPLGAPDVWQIWATNQFLGMPLPAFGSGQIRGNFFSITFAQSPGSTTAQLVSATVFGSVRTTSGTNFRQDAPSHTQVTMNAAGGVNIHLDSVTGYTPTNTESNELYNLWDTNAGADNTMYWQPLPLFAGPVYSRLQFLTAWANDFVLASAQNLLSGQMRVGSSANGILVNYANAVSFEVGTIIGGSNIGAASGDAGGPGVFILPQCPCYFVASFGATGQGASTGWTYHLVGQRYSGS